MIYLADTNFALRFAFRQNPQHNTVRQAVRALRQKGDEIFIVPQTCVEFWNAATRPAKNNGFGFSVTDADFFLRLVERIFPLLPDNVNVHKEWRKLVLNFGVSGIQVHDARIAAAMFVHQVTHILTFNTSDFARYSSLGIVAVDPKTL
ncbi:MAG TPA: type II toxin-antitoxin system VapC family toxin [Pyrinomonadaceae bacterium]|jgi:predicted nucleic acid-binding protein